MLCVLIRIASHNITFSIYKMALNYPKSAVLGFKNEFETTVANEPSVFEPLNFYCIMYVAKEARS